MKKARRIFAVLMALTFLLTGAASPVGETDVSSNDPNTLITYDYNGGKDRATNESSSFYRPGKTGNILLSDPYNVSCGENSVFLGWKKETEFDDPAATLYVDKIMHRNFFYNIKENETVAFKALWGSKTTIPVYPGEGFAFSDKDGSKSEKIDIDCIINNPYGVEFTSVLPGQALYSRSLYEGKSEYWLCNPYMDYSRKYILDGFVSRLTGKTYSLNDSYIPAEGDSLEAVWVRACRIYINYNGGENIRTNIAQEHTADVVKQDRYYYTYYNNPSRRNTIESRDDRYIVKPGYKFAGWKNSFDGRIYRQGEVFIPTANTIFNAIWEKCDGEEDRGPYSALRTVRYEPGGGYFRDDSSGRLLSADDDYYRAFFWNLRCRSDGYSESDSEAYIFNKPIKVGFFVGDTVNAFDYVNRHPYDRLRFASSAEYEEHLNSVLTCDSPFLVFRKGYRFLGWSLKDDPSGRIYKPGELYDPKGQDVTFVAQWEKTG